MKIDSAVLLFFKFVLTPFDKEPALTDTVLYFIILGHLAARISMDPMVIVHIANHHLAVRRPHQRLVHHLQRVALHKVVLRLLVVLLIHHLELLVNRTITDHPIRYVIWCGVSSIYVSLNTVLLQTGTTTQTTSRFR